ncbi:PREDICTED: phosphatidylinositol N-acetylglucosaminyltransferase subunit C [Rhagoletis zephyria]|uniref:phosphatidylinositol N-acetylglucosaminyltransferase subunit C n=1 Tax=Rhagoletis zephyria TaxID=28612 RepID=UPI00081165C3|nr:PREDICTED: phosphatidylinositol N-acetylglucosaminyltransferase subunit C [Rhagoletis zephyria]
MVSHSSGHWRKSLYENADYDDNYTDPSFLKDLRTNLNVRFFTFEEAFKGVTRLNNQISCVTLFLLIFYLLYSEHVTPPNVLFTAGLATSMGYIFYRGRKLFDLQFLLEDSKTLLSVLVFGYLFAPLLHRLTNAISTDTIFSMTFFVLLLNLIFCDYGLSAAMVSKALSLNAAIFAAICLASRLSTAFHAFVLLVEAAVFFVLYPIFISLYWQWYFLVPIFGVCCGLLYSISFNGFLFYVLFTGFINIFCPYIFVIQQRYKHNIHGPWDEAIVEENVEGFIENNL